MALIKSIYAVEILDSRGQPTVETTVILNNGISATAAVARGASRGNFEALDLRDNDLNRFMGLGVLKAVFNVNSIINTKLKGFDIIKQGEIDQTMIELDGTVNKSKLGANAILSVSLAVCKAAAKAINLSLYQYILEILYKSPLYKISKIPTPIFNVINGGLHGVGNLDFQEFQIIPSTIKPINEALRIGVEVYYALKNVLKSQNATFAVGDEGGFTPNFFTNLDALEAIMEAIRSTKYKFGLDIFLGLDVAANYLKKDDAYRIKDKPSSLTPLEIIEYFVDLHNNYRLLLLEDPLSEDDWPNWKLITQRLGKEAHIVGDDLLVTHLDRVKKAIEQQSCTAVLIKPNQVGTLSETLSVIKLAKENGLKIIISHRSGETNDIFLADLAVGVGADYVKFGAPVRGERVVKYNRLNQIARELKLVSNID